ncbi:MAG: hypothetical protein OEY01_03845 [Desulfobulbaceae bacterium]|nr:hypothetical protein [Desulfobulbaceae bacterium]
MNTLTLIRDLVYQKRFTESFRLVCNPARESIGLSYIKTHSENLKPNRDSLWFDNSWGAGYGCDSRYSYHSGKGFEWGDGWGYDWVKKGDGWSCGDGCGDGCGAGYWSRNGSSSHECKWKKCK